MKKKDHWAGEDEREERKWGEIKADGAGYLQQSLQCQEGVMAVHIRRAMVRDRVFIAWIVAVIVAMVEADQKESTRMVYDNTIESLMAIIIIATINSA